VIAFATTIAITNIQARMPPKWSDANAQKKIKLTISGRK
jgi:hypothetical protein